MTAAFITHINESFELAIQNNFTYAELKAALSEKIEQLFQHDFNKLVFLLYKIDVNEEKILPVKTRQKS